jgi:hypothetical protein
LACPKPEPGFPKTYVVAFFSSVMLWGERWLFVCLYWWVYWPSLFKISFHSDWRTCTNSTKNRMWIQVLRKGKQFLLH